MLWVKSLHIVFVVSWFAGLFYLPRIFVNLAMVPADSEAERARLLLMAGKLYRFMTPLGVLAVVLGLALWVFYDDYFVKGAWLHVKTLLALVLVAYHLYCGRLLRGFAADRNARGHVWFRWFNEMPVIVLFVVVWLVIFKPF
jgi:putative membrane protein